MQTQITREAYPILGVNISACSKKEFFSSVNERLENKDETSAPFFVVTVNPEIAVQSIIDNSFRDILQSSTINTADGMGIRWAVKYLYYQSVERITGSDSLEKICAYSAKLNQSVFFYGAGKGVAEQAAGILTQRNPGLKVEGVYSPASPDLEFEALPLKTQCELRQAAVVFVALGAPSQEKWIYEHLHRLSRCKLIIGIGGSLDFIAGTQKRAPAAFRKTGLEWVYRLYKQPARWRRMLRLPLFAINIVLLKASKTTLPKTDAVRLPEKELA